MKKCICWLDDDMPTTLRKRNTLWFSHLEMDFETFPAINKDSLNLVLRHLGICSLSMLSSVVHDLEVIFDVKYSSLSPLHVWTY